MPEGVAAGLQSSSRGLGGRAFLCVGTVGGDLLFGCHGGPVLFFISVDIDIATFLGFVLPKQLGINKPLDRSQLKIAVNRFDDQWRGRDFNFYPSTKRNVSGRT
jgi:hypothetical protein